MIIEISRTSNLEGGRLLFLSLNHIIPYLLDKALYVKQQLQLFLYQVRMNFWIACIFLVHHFFIKVCGKTSTHFISDQNYDDVISTDFVLSEKTFSTSVQCAMDCQSMEICKSFFFDVTSLSCRLVSVVIESTNGTTSLTGTRYFVDKLGKILLCNSMMTRNKKKMYVAFVYRFLFTQTWQFFLKANSIS